MGFQATPVGDGGMNGQRLLHLADIDEIGKAIPETGNSGTWFRLCAHCHPLILLVAFHEWRSNVEITLIGKSADDRH